MMQTATARDIAADIVAEGGQTWAPGKTAPAAGHMVSLPGTERVIPLHYFCASDVALYVADHAEKVTRDGRAYFGAWVDGDSVYLDISVNVMDAGDAVHLGFQWGQLAIYSIDADEVIELDHSTYRK
ncbi:hypothetical protein [Streptomyces sp. SID14515]|uniref:hypothetical protein n=1 Tax=Streptomyces sp. SID14515 TaxID=2706074 RepID=UPI0013C96B2A|nr:hypothetical protein [Streptomyces sp. SID14515]NEB35900.1 hypothetical protein [Streptomyces sp. SID14515]